MTADEMWAELVRRWHPSDPDAPDDNMRRYYQTKFEIARRLQPTIILEIGVRAGYSAFAFLSASPGAWYDGIELNAGTWGGQVDFTAHAQNVTLAGMEAHLTYADSQQVVGVSDSYGLVHIDGDHSYKGTLRDLVLCFPYAKWLLLDDYDFIPDVRRAAHDFLKLMGLRSPAFEHIDDGGFRGNLLIAGALNPLLEDRRL